MKKAICWAIVILAVIVSTIFVKEYFELQAQYEEQEQRTKEFWRKYRENHRR